MTALLVKAKSAKTILVNFENFRSQLTNQYKTDIGLTHYHYLKNPFLFGSNLHKSSQSVSLLSRLHCYVLPRRRAAQSRRHI